jgi:starvation-inducible DNA-binding protein
MTTMTTKATEKTKHTDMKADIGISEKNLQAIALELNKCLADLMVLYTKTRNYHWNIEGSNFMELHKFYENQYDELAEAIDEMAERIRALGHYAEGRMADFLKLTSLVEQEYTNDQRTQLSNLLDDHETIIRNLRRLIDDLDEKYKDKGTSDFLTGLLTDHEKTAWMIRSYLK